MENLPLKETYHVNRLIHYNKRNIPDNMDKLDEHFKTITKLSKKQLKDIQIAELISKKISVKWTYENQEGRKKTKWFPGVIRSYNKDEDMHEVYYPDEDDLILTKLICSKKENFKILENNVDIEAWYEDSEN